MKISSKGRYAVRVLVNIAKAESYVSLSEISQQEDITVKYLEQIISILLKANLVVSLRGAQGGYKLASPPSKISIAQVLEATKDMPNLAPCSKDNKACPKTCSCPTNKCWGALEQIICNYLNSVSLQDLIDKSL